MASYDLLRKHARFVIYTRAIIVGQANQFKYDSLAKLLVLVLHDYKLQVDLYYCWRCLWFKIKYIYSVSNVFIAQYKK